MGHSDKTWIEGTVGRIEAAFRDAESPRAAVVLAHPHPLYGGTLDNPVIFHADRELNRVGFATLRFNFRGVRASEGEHDGGRGEVDDLSRAVAWLRDRVPGAPLLLVGYSFGAVCSLGLASRDREIAGVIAVGLPVRLYPVSEIDHLSHPLIIVQGSADEFGSPEEIRSRVRHAPREVEVRVVDGANHLFDDRARAAAVAIVDAARELSRD